MHEYWMKPRAAAGRPAGTIANEVMFRPAALLLGARASQGTYYKEVATANSFATLPAGAMAVNKNGQTYCLSGNTWFLPAFGANGVHNTVVAAP